MNYLCIANQYAFLGRSHHLQKLNVPLRQLCLATNDDESH